MQGPKWQPLQKAHFIPKDNPTANRLLDLDRPLEVWMNNLYQVTVHPVPRKPGYEDWPEFVHLSIKRINKEPVTDWRHMQRIKNELVGEECEGVELYPAESRLVDSSNQFHMFVCKEPGTKFPFGFENRYVTEGSVFGSKQRPFERGFRPKDCIVENDETFIKRAEKALEEKKKKVEEAKDAEVSKETPDS